MPQLGPMEIMVIAVIALLVVGPRKLPDMARNVGRAMNEFRRHASDLKREFSVSLDDDDQAPAPSSSPPPKAEPADRPAADEAGDPDARDA